MALNWTAIQKLYSRSLEQHYMQCRAAGLECPIDVFEQLFFERHDDKIFTSDIAAIDWTNINWHTVALSGTDLRDNLGIPRRYEQAVNEARRLTRQHGLTDDRESVLVHWREMGTWLRDPVVIAGSVFGVSLQYQLRVGFTRLGNLLGLLDRGELPGDLMHRIWVGEFRMAGHSSRLG